MSEEKSIIREKSINNFTIISNEILKRNDLSWKAKGILAYIFSLPEDWKIYLEEVATHSTDGIKSFRSGWKELEEAGYVKRFPVRDEHKIVEWRTVISDKADLLSHFVHVEKVEVQNVHVQNGTLLNTNSTKDLYKQSTNTTKKDSDVEFPNSFPFKIGLCTILSREQMLLPNGKIKFVDEKRYGGNGMMAVARSDGKCEICGTEKNILIHHSKGYSNNLEDLLILCSSCHGKEHAKLKKEKTIPYQQIIRHLNNRCGTKFKHTSKKTRDLITARFNEGWELADFEYVIDVKAEQWEDDEKYSNFLRPETLFSNKFESYRNQKMKGGKNAKVIEYDERYGKIL